MKILAIVLTLGAAAAMTGAPLQGQRRSPSPAETFLRSQAAAAPSPLYRDALDTFLAVEALYWRGDYSAARARLDAFWQTHPPGTDEWAAAYRQAWEMQRSSGINIGAPPCYYALRMLTECLRWRLSDAAQQKPLNTATLTVVLVESAAGLEPASRAELERREGKMVTRAIEPLLLKDRSRVIHDSLRLFREYITAATDGRLAVRTRIQRLTGLQVPVKVSGGPPLFATLGDGAWERIWAAVPESVQRETDWWWVLYPSCIPEQYPDFARAEFITGGMGTGPDGVSPCFIIDDRWLTRKPPHLGKGPYSEIERRAYLPQWLQHEFMHHLFRIYPGFGLEQKDHQWFDRRTWPPDFEGRIEPDYYAEAMSKRLQPMGEPPLHIALKYTPPPRRLFAGLRPADLEGTYRHEPVQNDWHIGTLRLETVEGKPGMRWTNKAGATWTLRLDLANGLLRTGPDCPYYDAGRPDAAPFRILLRRDEEGRWLPRVLGFSFNGGVYTKSESEAVSARSR